MSHTVESTRYLKDWFETPLGQSLCETESEWLDRELSDVFGYNLLSLNQTQHNTGVRHSRVQRQFALATPAQRKVCADVSAAGITSAYHQLPIASDSQDVVILQHALEFCADPKQLLREVERITVARGRVIILAFNPFSLLGARCALTGMQRKGGGKFISAARSMDWLNLLGFEVAEVRYGFLQLPVSRPQRLREFNGRLRTVTTRLPFGGVYLLNAVKQRAGMTPSKPVWRSENFANVRPIAAARALAQNRGQSGMSRGEPDIYPDT